MLQGLVVAVMSLDPASALLLLHMSLVLFVCALVRCALTPSYSQPPAAKKRLVFLRDFPHLLCIYIFFSSSRSPPPASTSSFLSHTLLLWPHYFIYFFCHTLTSPRVCLLFLFSLFRLSSSSAF